MLNKPQTTQVIATVEWLLEMIERGRRERIYFPDVEWPPAVAQFVVRYLNPRNRKPRPDYITRFATMMSTPDRWLEAESELKFGSDGKLNDGQTRLHAVKRAGRPVRFAVSFGCDPRAHGGNMPTGNWSAKETLERAGLANPKQTSEVAKVLVNIDVGRPWTLTIVENDTLEAWGKQLEAMGIAADIAAARSINTQLKRCNVSIRALAAAIFLIRTTSPHADCLDGFVERLAYGTGLSKRNDPILVLREGLRERHWSGLKQAGALTLAWNAYVQGKPANRTKLTPGAEFPEVL